jgi:hypothetical protein
MATRRQIRKICGELAEYKAGHLTKDEYAIVMLYWEGIRNNDDDVLRWFAGMGGHIRQQVMNVNAYSHGLKLGFKWISFNEHGWLDHAEFPYTERISFEVKGEKTLRNYIDIAQGPNGLWVFGFSYCHGAGCGGGCTPHVFGEIFKRKEDAIGAGMQYMKKQFEYAVKQDDSTNYKKDYCNKILLMINQHIQPQGQLVLF